VAYNTRRPFASRRRIGRTSKEFDRYRDCGATGNTGRRPRTDLKRRKLDNGRDGIVMSGRRPLIKGFFEALCLIVGAVMSSACRVWACCPSALMLSADPLPLSHYRARLRRQRRGLQDQSAFLHITSWSPSTPVLPQLFDEPWLRTQPALVTPELLDSSSCCA
jgi:hypothetical protein